MRRQWAGIKADAQRSMTSAQRREVRAWRERLARMSDGQRALRRAGHWIHGRPDFLGVLGRERRETYHSTMLGWLLDPGAPTGLGTRFLRRFLTRVDPAFSSISSERLASVSVQCEVSRRESRTDVVIFGDDFVVAVEVKVDANEGPDQCLRIYRDFRDDPGARFVFLTPGGRLPSTAIDDAEGVFVPLSYRSVARLLESVLADSAEDHEDPVGPHEVGRATCRSYAFTLKQEFHG